MSEPTKRVAEEKRLAAAAARKNTSSSSSSSSSSSTARSDGLSQGELAEFRRLLALQRNASTNATTSSSNTDTVDIDDIIPQCHTSATISTITVTVPEHYTNNTKNFDMIPPSDEDAEIPQSSIGDCCARTSSKWSSVFPFGIGKASNIVHDCLLDSGGLVKGWSYCSSRVLESLDPQFYEEVDLPAVQLRGVGVKSQPILFTRAVLLNVFIDGVLASKPSEHRTLKRKIFLRVTDRENIHHDVVFNEGDINSKLRLTLQTPERTVWWNSSDAASQRTKIVPSFIASLAASAAEEAL
jgi:hypothetical protein